MSDLREEGRQLFLKHGGKLRNCHDYFNGDSSTDNGLKEWGDFFQGFTDAMKDYDRSRPNIKAFLEDLDVICKKHSVSVSSGCGCCGAGGMATDEWGNQIEFSF